MPLKRKRIVIVGAGFAGLTAATAISKRYDVTVIDPTEEFVWTPNIHEILSGVKTARDVVLDSRKLVEGAGHRFLRARAEALDTARREVRTDSGEACGYDACLLAPGAGRDRLGVPGAMEHAIGFRSADDATAVEQRLTGLARGARKANVVIIGAGVSGIEALGEILRRHRDGPAIALHVVEREDRILPDLPRALAEDVRARLAGLSVHWHTGSGVARIDKRNVVLATGKTLRSDLAIWSAGLAPRPFLREAGLIPPGRHWAPVRQTLQSEADAAVFVAGDSAALASPLRKQAYHAIDMGEYAAWNLQHFLRGRPLKDFRPAAKPLLISLGDLDTYLVTGAAIIASPLLAAAKESVYQFYMARFSLGLPPLAIAAGFLARGGNAVKSLVLPEVLSCASLARIRGSRVIRTAAG